MMQSVEKHSRGLHVRPEICRLASMYHLYHHVDPARPSSGGGPKSNDRSPPSAPAASQPPGSLRWQARADRRVAWDEGRVLRLPKMPSPPLNEGTTARLRLSCCRELTAARLLCRGRRRDSAAYEASQVASASSMNGRCSAVRKGDARQQREQRTELAPMSWLRAHG